MNGRNPRTLVEKSAIARVRCLVSVRVLRRRREPTKTSEMSVRSESGWDGGVAGPRCAVRLKGALGPPAEHPTAPFARFSHLLEVVEGPGRMRRESLREEGRRTSGASVRR